MKKILSLIAVFVLALGLCSCAAAKFGVESDGTSIHAKAENKAEGSGTGQITIEEEGYGLCINHIVEKGSFHVKITAAATSEVVFDDDITDNILNLVDVGPGDYDVIITAKNAVGTIDIILYDKEAQAMADGTMPEQLKDLVEADKKMTEDSASAASADSTDAESASAESASAESSDAAASESSESAEK